MWSVQLLLVLSKMDSIFCYIPEFYVEALVYTNSSFLMYWKSLVLGVVTFINVELKYIIISFKYVMVLALEHSCKVGALPSS